MWKVSMSRLYMSGWHYKIRLSIQCKIVSFKFIFVLSLVLRTSITDNPKMLGWTGHTTCVGMSIECTNCRPLYKCEYNNLLARDIVKKLMNPQNTFIVSQHSINWINQLIKCMSLFNKLIMKKLKKKGLFLLLDLKSEDVCYFVICCLFSPCWHFGLVGRDIL